MDERRVIKLLQGPEKISPKKILVIPLRYIGDTVLSVPLLRNLRQAYPQAVLDVLLSPGAAPILANCPYVSHCQKEPRGALAVQRFLKQERYDLVILLRKSFSMALAAKLSGAKVVGYDKQRFPWGFSRWALGLDGVVEYPHRDTDSAQALHHLKMLEALGHPGVETRTHAYLELWPTAAERQAVARLMAENGIDVKEPIAVIHTVSASYGKSIDAERLSATITELLERGFQVLFSGIASDSAAYEQLLQAHPEWRQAAQASGRIHNLAGKTTLGEIIALYRQVDVLITVDSSPVHLGLAAGVPKILAIYGPTNYRQWGAYPGVRPPEEPTLAFLPLTADDQSPQANYLPQTSHIDIASEKILSALRQLLAI